jgi:hypothetical protein
MVSTVKIINNKKIARVNYHVQMSLPHLKFIYLNSSLYHSKQNHEN